jgi:signal transduction histidine kinase
VVPAALAAVEAEAGERRITIETEVEPAMTVGDPRLLERLIGNLVENGVRHNVNEGWLRVSTGETDERAWLHVSNGGPVIASAEVDSLFEPFRRGGRVRTATRGAGLGLAIVRLIVDAHHGRMQAAAPPFGGLAIRIELPRHTGPKHRAKNVDAVRPEPSAPKDEAQTAPEHVAD